MVEGPLDARPLRLDGASIVAQASIGVAALPHDGVAGDALRIADRAMYRRKRERGRQQGARAETPTVAG